MVCIVHKIWIRTPIRDDNYHYIHYITTTIIIVIIIKVPISYIYWSCRCINMYSIIELHGQRRVWVKLTPRRRRHQPYNIIKHIFVSLWPFFYILFFYLVIFALCSLSDMNNGFVLNRVRWHCPVRPSVRLSIQCLWSGVGMATEKHDDMKRRRRRRRSWTRWRRQEQSRSETKHVSSQQIVKPEPIMSIFIFEIDRVNLKVYSLT